MRQDPRSLPSEGAEHQCPHAAPLAMQAEALSTAEGTAKGLWGRAGGRPGVGRCEQKPCQHDHTAGHLVPILQTAQPPRAAVHRDSPCSLSAASHWRSTLHTSSMLRTLWTSEKSPGRNVTVLEPCDRVLSQENIQRKPETSQELEEPT